MLKKKALKKICISTLALIIVSIIHIFPDSTSIKEIKNETSYKNAIKTAIYLPNTSNLVSRTMLLKKEKNINKRILEIIDYLTVNSKSKDYIPEIFEQIIPENTKVINIDLNDGILKINFSKELLNVSEEKEKKLIESLVYSLTELNEVDKIMIFVDGEKLNSLPHSKARLPITLDRKIGINTIYNINDLKDTEKITTYYISKASDNYYYYTPITTVSNFNEDKINVIIKELKQAPIYQTNLMSFLTANVELKDYEILENKIKLSFNNYIFDDFNKKTISEEVKYSISLSIRDTYNIDTVIYNVDNEDIEEFSIIKEL